MVAGRGFVNIVFSVGGAWRVSIVSRYLYVLGGCGKTQRLVWQRLRDDFSRERGHYSRRVRQLVGYEPGVRPAYILTHITLQRIGATSGGLAKHHTPRDAEGPV